MDDLADTPNTLSGISGADKAPAKAPAPWWKGASIYQIYPRSFYDSTGDGIGDLSGIIQKLDYVASLGVDAIWLSPFFTSPMIDYGYDVADFCNVDPMFGTLADFDRLTSRAHELGLKVIIDQVYSHTSDRHPWFEQSRESKDNPKSDWYVWADPNSDGTPPNNWQSVFSGPAWQWDARRGQYYLHNFLPEQPDLNLHNPAVQEAVLGVMKFWLARGVDGFRLDALNFGFHDQAMRDNPPAKTFKRPPTRPHDYQAHIYNMSQPEILPLLERIRQITNDHGHAFTVAEIGGPFPLKEMKDYTRGDNRLNSVYAFDFLYADSLSANLIRKTLSDWPGGEGEGWPSWAFSNHDAPRAISRWCGDCDPARYARLLIMILVSLRGNIFIYQGEELGLPQAHVDFDDLKDPEAIANWPKTLGRDGARTPMPWQTDNRHAGFSSAKPWLPVSPQHAQLSVAAQQRNTGSTYHFYQKALGLRRDHPPLREGGLRFDDTVPDLLVIYRITKHERFVGVFNITADALSIEHVPFDPNTILLSVGDIAANARNLPAYSGFIAKLAD